MVTMVTMAVQMEVTKPLLKSNMHRVFLIVTLCFCTCLFLYPQNEKWQVYPAFSEAIQVEVADNYLYCIMKGSGTLNSQTGNLVRYDVDDGSLKTYDCIHDLNDKEISRISYNTKSERLIILYKNGNIDLLDSDDGVYNIPALKDKSILGDDVTGISHVDETVFFCTSNSIIELDSEAAVINETYKSLDGIAYSIVQIDGMLYISTSKGLFCVSAGSNMHDKALWQSPISKVVYTKLAVHDSHLFGCKLKGVDEIKLDGTPLSILESALSYFLSVEDKLVFGVHNRVFIYEGEYTSRWDNIQIPTTIFVNGITCHNDRYYIAGGIDGLVTCTREENQFADMSRLFTIDSPRNDLFYHMNYAGDRLMVAGGINTQLASYYPVTFMFMEDNGIQPHWTLFDEKSPKEAYPHLTHYNAVDLVQDPADANHFYGAVYRNGLHEYRMNEDGEINFVGLYNYENSPLRCIAVNTPRPWNYCTCTALQYDGNGNLWMANQQTDTIVRIMRPNGKWISLYYPEIVESENVFQYLFSSCGINFMVTYEGGKRGFFGFDTNGTLNMQDDDRHLLRNTITNQDGTTVLPTQFYCLTEDHDAQIWCGTNEGLFVMTNPQSWFENDFRFHQIKRNRNDGSGYADYLLAGVHVTCIAVDPSNRKWIGTSDDGVYLVSHDGQETIYHFTTENSHLLSDYIHSIAINPKTGIVMFGTNLGLCSYSENVVEAETTLSESNIKIFPNPVRPNTNAIVTIQGLTDGAEVKIVGPSGQVVWGTKSIGGSVRWNCCNISGNRVSSGIYHVICNTEDASQTIVTRLVVLK